MNSNNEGAPCDVLYAINFEHESISFVRTKALTNLQIDISNHWRLLAHEKDLILAT